MTLMYREIGIFEAFLDVKAEIRSTARGPHLILMKSQ